MFAGLCSGGDRGEGVGGYGATGIAMYHFRGIVVGRKSHAEKRGDNRKKKFLTSNFVEAQHQLVILEISPSDRSFYSPLYKELRSPIKGLINVQNDDNKCFKYSLARYLKPVMENPAK